MVQINWTTGALSDLKEISDYISKDSVRYAQVVVIRILAKAELLESQPMSGRQVPELMREDIREMIEGRYRIIYRIVSKERVDILTIHHTSRLLENNPSIKRL